ncbi:MAG: TatD family hydrolase [Myxococcales bacterium]
MRAEPCEAQQPGMFDSHCHLDDDAFDADRGEVLARARSAGLTGIVVPGYEPAEWADLAHFCEQDPLLCCGVGLHPWYVPTLEAGALEAALQELPASAARARAVAIGECGLDGAKARRGGASMELQKRVLERHLDVASALALPVILHCVDAHGALLELLERRGPLTRGGVMHSYSGPADLIARYARLGLYFSFAGVVSHENAKRPRKALCGVPLSRLLVESDGPDQAAEGAGSRRSEPAHIVRLLDIYANLRTESRADLGQACADNGAALFAR